MTTKRTEQARRRAARRWYERHKDTKEYKERARHASKKHYENNKEKVNKQAKYWYQNNPLKSYLARIKCRAKANNLPFELTTEDINPPDRCECCGREDVHFNFMFPGSRDRNKLTIDRVIPKYGYTKSNIAWLCWRCNELKSDGSIEDFKKILDFMISRQDAVLVKDD